ncbi:hypothetical protein [Halomonas binhaiensis]|uniref:DUF945 family protein n=1 Tax=Halomonas binhaiensis TaxID=2562282 RepID=A0A5C1NAW0_9GAMM|nr:hypothetical protein [Halomonas binhaiensis]QEM80842.1 hypothetical protein E4T21_04205 [Halomonas binhaiensis]
MSRLNFVAAAALGVALIPGLAQADAEQLEQDLRTKLSSQGELKVAKVSDSFLGGTTTAEQVRLVDEEGGTTTIGKYIVKGDYEDPDEVILEGINMVQDQATLTMERMTFTSPGQAVLDLEDLPYTAENPLKGVSLKGLVLDQSEGEVDLDLPFGVAGGRIELDELSASDLSEQAIGSLTLSGLSATSDDFGDIGAGTIVLPSLTFSGLTGIETDKPTVDSFELKDLDIATDKLVMTLGHLVSEGDLADGKFSGNMEALSLNLAKMIELAPADERTNLRMLSNVLTGGSGQLDLDAKMDGSWRAQGANGQLDSQFEMTATDALRFGLDAGIPLTLPKGAEPAEYFANLEDWTELDTQGGDMTLTLSNLGAFERIAPVAATLMGVSENEWLEQIRTQAKGMSTMMGPEIGAVLSGLVQMMDGKAKDMTVSLALPPSAEASKLAQDPLGLPAVMQMQVNVK